jgi:hypothetical protein
MVPKKKKKSGEKRAWQWQTHANGARHREATGAGGRRRWRRARMAGQQRCKIEQAQQRF